MGQLHGAHSLDCGVKFGLIVAKYYSYVGRFPNDYIIVPSFYRIGASLTISVFLVSWGSAGVGTAAIELDDLGSASGFGIERPGALKPENSYTTVKMISPMGISSKLPYEEGELVLK